MNREEFISHFNDTQSEYIRVLGPDVFDSMVDQFYTSVAGKTKSTMEALQDLMIGLSHKVTLDQYHEITATCLKKLTQRLNPCRIAVITNQGDGLCCIDKKEWVDLAAADKYVFFVSMTGRPGFGLAMHHIEERFFPVDSSKNDELYVAHAAFPPDANGIDIVIIGVPKIYEEEAKSIFKEVGMSVSSDDKSMLLFDKEGPHDFGFSGKNIYYVSNDSRHPVYQGANVLDLLRKENEAIDKAQDKAGPTLP